MMDFSNFSIDFASFFAFKLVLLVAAVSFVIYSFLMTRQIQLMNRVLKTSYSPIFTLIGSVFVFASIGLVVVVLLSFIG